MARKIDRSTKHDGSATAAQRQRNGSATAGLQGGKAGSGGEMAGVVRVGALTRLQGASGRQGGGKGTTAAGAEGDEEAASGEVARGRQGDGESIGMALTRNA